MAFNIHGNIALVTGGVSGIGLQFLKELIRCGIKGVTISDINADLAEKVLVEIEKEFGSKKTLFVKTDVTDMQQFENAFLETVEKFKHVDILINNAGICYDKMWQKEVAVNINGIVHGMLLGLENYLPKHRQGPEAVIVNVSAVSAIGTYLFLPIYSGTKAAIVQMTRTWDDFYHYERTKVRVFSICPGLTLTPLVTTYRGTTLGRAYEDWMELHFDILPLQEPKHVAQETRKLINSCQSGTVWIIEEGESAFQYVFPDRGTMRK